MAMDKEFFNEYVEKRYKDQLNYYSKASAKNQKRYKQFQWILIMLSASTPILAAFDPQRMQIPVIIIFCAGGCTYRGT